MTLPRRGLLATSLPAQAALLLAVCIVVYWACLGDSGFSMSEGHRVVPGWETAQDGSWFRTTMFGQAYYRKPPGMPWAIAVSSMVLGETEFSARAVSALALTLASLASWWFAGRWFGRSWGLVSGLATALTPLFWEPGRSAEIEALNNFGTLLACFALVDLAAPRERVAGERPGPAMLLLGLGVLILALAKGPASLPVVGATAAGCLIARRGLGGVPWLWLLIPLAAAATVLTLIARRIWDEGLADPLVVTQSPGEFLWDKSRLAQIALLIPAAIAAGLPATLAPILIWFRTPADEATPVLRARALGLGFFLALLAYTLIGVSNARYGMPAVVLCGPLWAWWAGGVAAGGHGRVLRRGLAVAAGVLLIGAVGHNVWLERLRNGDGGRGSARPAGIKLADDLYAAGARGTVNVIADGVVEARPELLLYARRRGLELGLDLCPVWVPSAENHIPPNLRVLLALRTDAESDELRRYQEVVHTMERVAEGKMGKYTFAVFAQITQFHTRPPQPNP